MAPSADRSGSFSAEHVAALGPAVIERNEGHDHAESPILAPQETIPPRGKPLAPWGKSLTTREKSFASRDKSLAPWGKPLPTRGKPLAPRAEPLTPWG